ncbi:zf-PARP-domain-containing protein, partial [Amniculicola lignicola CBS 123094]
EISPNNRAVCKNAECKKAGVKITKGELRFATFFTINDHTSAAFKHWGCVTPAQVENIQTESEGNLDMIDGYDELPASEQKKVRAALAAGHVADEDWRGDVEVNRPGQKGFRVKKTKAKKGKKGDEVRVS